MSQRTAQRYDVAVKSCTCSQENITHGGADPAQGGVQQHKGKSYASAPLLGEGTCAAHLQCKCQHSSCRSAAARGQTLGKMPAKNICRVGSCSLWLRDMRPRFSDRSWNRILMKMRLLEVVSSSVRRMHASTDQLSASVVNRCCTNTTHALTAQP